MALLAIWPEVTVAVPIVSLNNPGSTTLHEVQVAPGGTFDADLNLNTDVALHDILFLRFQASASNVFDVAMVTINPPWVGGSGMVGDVDPISNIFGAGLPFYFGPGMTKLAGIQFFVDPAASPGSYTIDIRDAGYSIGSGATYCFKTVYPGPSFEVLVVPEPMSIAIFIVCSLFMPRRWF
jgi:hypothetical protein